MGDHSEVSNLETSNNGANLMDLPNELIYELLPKLDFQDFRDIALAKLNAKKLDRDLQYYFWIHQPRNPSNLLSDSWKRLLLTHWTQRNFRTNPSAHKKAVFSGYDVHYYALAKFSKTQFDEEMKKVAQFKEKLALLANFAQTCKRNKEIVDSYCKSFFKRNEFEISNRFNSNERIRGIMARLQNGEKLTVAQLMELKIEEYKITEKTHTKK